VAEEAAAEASARNSRPRRGRCEGHARRGALALSHQVAPRGEARGRECRRERDRGRPPVFVAAAGRVVTARIRHALLGLQGSLAEDGTPLVDELPWTDPASHAKVEAAVGVPIELEYADEGAFDVLPISVATDGTARHLGIDHRRLRPNIVVAGVEGLAERDWPEARLRIGEVVIYVVRLRPRCVMTTFDPDSLEQDRTVLQRITDDLGGAAALDCTVEQPGVIRVGDPVEVAA
jgi:uncharacterized protein